jgi:hypothetical protein
LLKAAIIYLQGSGGGLLTRTLALSEQTVAYLPKAQQDNQPSIRVSAQDRIKLYNNWNSRNWTASETGIGIGYHTGPQDFYEYENSDLWLIDSFHPAMFEYSLDKKVLFTDTSAWEHLIFIKWKESSLDTIIKLAKLKRSDLDHPTQIRQNELDIFKKLTNTYSGLSIQWEDMLEENTYIESITKLAQELNLVLDFSLVAQLWKSWKIETEKILNERS